MEKLLLIGFIILSSLITSIVYNWYLYNIKLPKIAPNHPYAKYLTEKKQRKLEKKRQKQKLVEE